MTDEEHSEQVAAEQPKRKRKRRVLIDVTIVAQEAKGALVQWMIPDTQRVARGYIEASAIEKGRCDEEVLAAAHRYGVPWRKLVGKLLLEIDLNPQRVEDALYAHGIWTVADIEQNTVRAMHAISLITGRIVPMLHGEGGKYEKEGQGG